MSFSSAIAFQWMVQEPIDNKSTFGSGNGLVPSGTDQLPAPMLT